MAIARSPISSRKPRKRASSSSRPTRNRAVTWSSRPSARELRQAAGRGLHDVVGPGLKVLFVGINPGLYSAATGFHFARPGNRFWPALHGAGLTPRVLHPSEQSLLLASGCGVTNLVNRATATAAQLRPDEFVRGRGRLAAKVRRHRPRIVVFLGVGAFAHAFGLRNARIGAQPAGFEGAGVWVLPNPSGLNANYQLADFIGLFRKLKRAAWR